MSQLFDKYKDKFVDIPNNQFRFLAIPKEYKDTLTIGVDNEHTFQLPYEFSELRKIEITYIQGTENKLTKTFYADKFIEENFLTEDDLETSDIEEDINPNEGMRIFDYIEGGAKLFQLDRNMVDSQLQKFGLNKEDDLPTYCVLYYDLNTYDTLLFNNYNKEVYVQMKLFIDIKDDTEETEKCEYSRIFKLKLQYGIQDTTVKPDEDIGMNLAYEEVK